MVVRERGWVGEEAMKGEGTGRRGSDGGGGERRMRGEGKGEDEGGGWLGKRWPEGLMASRAGELEEGRRRVRRSWVEERGGGRAAALRRGRGLLGSHRRRVDAPRAPVGT